MHKDNIKYYEEYCDEPKFEGKQKEAMEFAMDECYDFINGLDEGIQLVEGEKTKGFYIELADVGELMNKWKKLTQNPQKQNEVDKHD